MKNDSPMYCDKGEFIRQKNRVNSRVYGLWNRIRGCCYGNNIKKNLSYKGCTVGPEFYSFQAFAAWATKQIGFAEGFQLDKDLLIKGNRVYAPDRCVFLPLEVNSILIKNSNLRGDLPIGVTFNRAKTRVSYVAAISMNQKNRRIGTYETAEEAFAAYKEAKEAAIKAVAEKYKDAIDPRAYAALMAYQVEITD